MPRVIRDHGNEKKGRRIRKLSLVMKGGTVYYPAELTRPWASGASRIR
jgi:phage pi2 protein 07